MIRLKDNEKIALAGLLHDIGKLLNRSNKYSKFSKFESKQHPHLSSWFIDFLVENNIIDFDEELKELVQKHHEGQFFSGEINLNTIKETRDNKFMKKMGLIVARSDNYSSFERVNEENRDFSKKDFRKVPLDSIFTRIKLTKNNTKDEKSKYGISTFNEQNIFPKSIEENSQNSLDIVIDKFLQEVKEIKVQNFDSLFINLLDLLKKYTWSLPSDTQKNICDISLFDHLKTTSAIALASYNYHTETNGSLENTTQESIKKDKIENHFLLIGGDISGIQKYIYALENTDKTSKRLRSRSFFIKLLSDVGAYKIVKDLNLTPANIIISSGGKFYILAQNTENSLEQVAKIKKEINNFLYREYQGDLFLNLEWLEISGEDLGESFSKKYDELNDKLDIGKNKKFVDNILNETILENKDYGNGKKVTLCKICNKYLVEDSEEQCEHCKKDEDFGKYLPSMKYLAFYTENFSEIKKDDKTLELFGVLCKIYTDDKIEGEPYIINYYLEDVKRNRNYQKDVYGGYAPTDEKGIIKTFEDIANESKSKNLGIIKGDVDNLGLIFSIGMKGFEEKIIDIETGEEKNKKDVISISRISTLSRMLDNFFSYWLPKTLETKKDELGSNYVVYSGGDDFMIVSSWDNSIKVARFINEKFRDYIGRNSDITITMGISITKPSEPIYYSSTWATEAEEKGKSSGKNGLVVFDSYIPWEDVEKIFGQSGVAEFINSNFKTKENEKNLYNQGFIYRLLTYTDMAEKYKECKNPKYLKYISDFTYDLARNIVPRLKEEYKNNKNLSSKEIDEKIKKDRRITELMKYFGIETINNKDNFKFLINYMRVVLNYVVRLNRDVE